MDGLSRLHNDADDAPPKRLDCCVSELPQDEAAIARVWSHDSDDEERSRLRGSDVEMPGDPNVRDDEQEQHHLRATSKKTLKAKQEVAATLLKMDHFADRLASIRSEIAARNTSFPVAVQSQQQQLQHLPRTQASHAHTQAPADSRSFERLKLPLIQLLASNNESAAHPSDSFLSIDAVQQRAALQQQFTSDAERLAAAERVAVDALQNADRLAEESRIAMVIYTQNERSWGFDERANRYQKVLEAKRLAEITRSDAEDQQAAVQALRSRLVNPYRTLVFGSHSQMKRPFHLSPRSAAVPSESIALGTATLESEEFIYVWILAAPSTNLSFTPRELTAATILAAEKELSTHVVYYAAASSVNEEDLSEPAVSESDRIQRLTEDTPPRNGWVSCSSHGVAPVPDVKSVKSSIETWVVSGAGVGHLNGKYILNGIHDHVRKFKSSTGVELFRKRVPVSSSLAQGLHDAPVEKKGTKNRDTVTPGTPGFSDPDAVNQPEEQEGNVTTSAVTSLPSVLKVIESEETSFQSMSRIGSWLGSNEMKEKYRRRRENESKKSSNSSSDNGLLNSSLRVREDGDHVMTQDAKGRLENSMDIQVSRPEASAELCREWVLFMGCSKCHMKSSDGSSIPPAQNSGLGCLKRHYYISVEEKETMAIWAQEEEAKLEQRVLESVIKREEQIARVHRLCDKCMSKFQQNLTRDTDKVARKILEELNTVRFLSVKVLESIEKWRAHARKLGFARFDAHNNNSNNNNSKSEHSESSEKTQSSDEKEPPLLGWSASITVSTGRQLFKGSNAFVSKVKRFCRAEDAVGKKEQQIVYLGYFGTRMEAERAYEEYATAEARRLNTTVAHLPRHRNVFRSCGKHFAVESERLGPSVCIECKVKQLASLSSGAGAGEWAPPFFYTPGENYILKMGNDLDFLDSVPPIVSLLNDGHGSDEGAFPILGNVFLLPKTPIQDPSLAIFTTCGLARAPRLGIALEKEKESQEINDETLDRERILIVQKIFLQELQIYCPELFPESTKLSSSSNSSNSKKSRRSTTSTPGDDQDAERQQYRLVEALYWDRCAALKIQQRRAPLAFRQENIWCRPDAGEWASLAVRGKHQQHFLFELKLTLVGKEMQEKRKQVLKALRRLLKTPLYWIHSREHFTKLIDEGCNIKGDVVMLEVKSATKYLDKYDTWCRKTLVIQRWFRGVCGRRRAKTRRRALRLVCGFRKRVATRVASLAKSFYEDQIVPCAIRKAVQKISKPEFTTALKLNGEFVIVSFHSLRFSHQSHSPPIQPHKSSRGPERSVCCAGCARRFHVRAEYKLATGRFQVSNGGVCCCSLNSGSDRQQLSGTTGNSESWLVRAYNPTSNTTYRMKMENALVRQLLSTLSPPKFGRLSSSVSTPSSSDNPVTLKWALHESAVVASIQANFYRKQGEKAYQELLNWRLLSSEATQKRKTAVIHRDRTVKTLENLKRSYLLSIDSAKAVLDFTSRKFHEAQAWDPLENANDWKLLVHKRQLQKELEATENELDKCRLEVFQSSYNEQFLRVRAGQVQDQYENGWLPLIQCENQQMESASTLETCSKTLVERCMRQICSHFLTLRDGYFLPTRRNLVLQSSAWKERSGVRIALPGLLRCRNVMRRRVLRLSNFGKTQQVSERMVVEISVSPSPSNASDTTMTRTNDFNIDVWVVAYNPKTSFVQEVFLEWELVELLVGLKSKQQQLLCNTDQRRSALQTIAGQLLSMAMLDRFTGKFTLRKLQFYHHMRLLRPQFLSSKWFLDVKKGRKCGAGDEILRQAACVDGKLVVVNVFENWGDLTFAMYHAAMGETFHLTVDLNEIFRLLSAKPLMLRLWVCCVKANNYNPSILMYLLKHVRFQRRDNDKDNPGNEMTVAVFEPHVPSASASKRFQKVMTIQKRKVLLSIKEDVAGDFELQAFDWKQNHSYKLVLEREHIRRLLRRTKEAFTRPETQASPSYRYLMLQKNRVELFEWISSRLTFQSLLEHPQLLATAHSPLAFGAHLRQSFHMFNQWVSSSIRNPLQCVGSQELNVWAAHVDAAAFSQLQFDQLALVAEQAMSFDYDKETVGTLDWFTGSTSLLSSERATESPYLKMDFFLKNHNLFVRLRDELQLETATRLERTSRGALETQEKLSLWAEIQGTMESMLQMLTNWQQCAERARTITEERATVLRQLHLDLARRVKADDVVRVQPKDVERSATGLFFSNDGDADEASIKVDLHKLFKGCSSASDADFVTKVLGISSGALDVASRFLSKCGEYIESTLKPALAKLDASINVIVQQHQQLQFVSLKTLKGMWREVLRFQSSTIVTNPTFDSVVPEPPVLKSLDWSSIPGSGDPDSVVSQGEDSEDCSDTLPHFETGILIPSSCDDPMQEIFLSGGNKVCISSLAATLKTLVAPTGNLRPKPSDQHIGISILVKPVHDGVLAFQTPTNSSLSSPDTRAKVEWNPRAYALAMERSGVLVVGPALYYRTTHTSDRSFLDRLECITTLHHKLALVSDPELSNNNSQVARRKQQGGRVKQQLPWKVYASERMQVARSLKRMRAAEQIALNHFDTTTTMAMESKTLTTLVIPFRELELLFGDCFSVNQLRALLPTEIASLLAVNKRRAGNNAGYEWTLRVTKPLSMRNALLQLPLGDSNANGRGAALLSETGTAGGLRLEHLQVEIDSLEQTKRLIFSCRELQSQRKYYLDCSYHHLQAKLLTSRGTKDTVSSSTTIAAPVLSIADWRRFAQRAAQLLVFRKKNGALGLDFTSPGSESTFDKAKTNSGDDQGTASSAPAPVESSTCAKQRQSELKSVMVNCLRRRFEKHQVPIRSRACSDILSSLRKQQAGLGSEWVRMTKEDFAAHESRGQLVLDAKMLKKLQSALATATKHAKALALKSLTAAETGTTPILKQQLTEFVKEMELSEENVDISAMEQTVFEMRESAQRLKRKRPSIHDETRNEAPANLKEIAEWWRRHKLTEKEAK